MHAYLHDFFIFLLFVGLHYKIMKLLTKVYERFHISLFNGVELEQCHTLLALEIFFTEFCS